MVDAVTGYPVPVPALNDENRPFWQACRSGVLRMHKCLRCAHVRHPTSRFCPRCMSGDHEWMDMSGRGTVLSFIVFHQTVHPETDEDIPYNVALVQLEEGPRMFSSVVGVAHDEVRAGDKVEVTFESVTPEITIPRFKPRKET